MHEESHLNSPSMAMQSYMIATHHTLQFLSQEVRIIQSNNLTSLKIVTPGCFEAVGATSGLYQNAHSSHKWPQDLTYFHS